MERIENKFSIKRIKKTTDSDYTLALKIYNETTAIDVKTNTNEITYWLDQPVTVSSSFELMVFVLYLDDTPIGFAMMCYLKRTKVILIDYLSVYDEYRINAVLFPYLSLLQSYLNKNGYDVSYIVNEVSDKNNGQSINKESKMFKKLFCLEGFGKICSTYYFPQLGYNNPESIFKANLYIKSNDNITLIQKVTYLSIVESIYKDYNLAWYIPIFTNDGEKNQYVSTCEQYIGKIEKDATDELIPVNYMECPVLIGNNRNNVSGVLPASKKSKIKTTLPLTIASIIVCPIFIIWLYTFILEMIGVPLDSVGTAIGTAVSALIASISALVVTRKKL